MAEATAIPWTLLSFPAEATEAVEITFPISGRVVTRQPGDVLWPEREGPVELANVRASMRDYAYSGQYQQNPVPLGGNMFDPRDWRFWTVLPDRTNRWWTSWDMTFGDGARSDFVVGQVWCANQADVYLVHQFRKRCDFPATRDAVKSLAKQYPRCSAHVVEGKANGKGIIADLRTSISGFQEFNPDLYGDKIERANLVLDQITSGNVYLPDPKIQPWVSQFIETFAAFPDVTHDDEVDALTQALIWYKKRKMSGMPGGVGGRDSYWKGGA